jgi:hypothetical protein
MKTEPPNPPIGATFATPAFDEAVSRLREFIKSQGGTTDLFWIFREDVIVGPNNWIRFPVPMENAELAAGYYEFGRDQGFGVTLAAHSLVGDRFACYVWVPKDKSEAADRLQAPCLKLSVHSGRAGPFRVAHPLASRLSWRYHCWRNRRWQELRDCLPSRLEATKRVTMALNK